MKKVTVEYMQLPDKPKADGFLLDDVKDIDAIIKKFDRLEDSIIKKFVTSGESPDRYGHVISGLTPLETPIAQLACVHASITGLNPIHMLPKVRTSLIDSLMTMINDQSKVFMRYDGVITPVLDKDGNDYLRVIKEEVFCGFEPQVRYEIRKNTKYLNLENAWELERVAADWLYKHDGYNFSYITELSLLSKFHLNRLMSEFVGNGGKYLYVYTTGQNHEQMYEYSEVALLNGIKNFIFDFNLGLDDDINAFLTWLRKKAKVRLVDSKKDS